MPRAIVKPASIPAARNSRCAAIPCSMHLVRHGIRRAHALTAHTISSAVTACRRLPSGTLPSAMARRNGRHATARSPP